jgi:exodeoxyribonuclease-3
VKITTWNVNGVRAREAQLLEWVQRERPDVICLQEVKASPEDVPASLCSLEGYWCYWHGYKGYSGVGLHLRKELFPVQPRYFHPPFDHEQRIVCAQVDDLLIASIYVPNGKKEYPPKVRFLEALDELVVSQLAAGTRLLLCGDLNVAREPRDVHTKIRDPKEIGQTPEEQAMLEKIIGRGLTDLLRHYDPGNDELFTWWAPWRKYRERNIGWRLDYVLASRAVADLAEGCASFREFGASDHAPVNATFKPGLVKVPADAPPQTPVEAPSGTPAGAPAPPAGQLSLDLGSG